jgi:hypothetical protein
MTAADRYKVLTLRRRHKWDCMLSTTITLEEYGYLKQSSFYSLRFWIHEETQATQALLERPLHWWRLD